MVNPSDPVAAFQVTWSMHREKFVAEWDKVGESAWSPLFASQHQKWTPDDSVATGNADLDLTIENNHIYFIDVPGQYGKTRPPDYVQMYANFRNLTYVHIYGQVYRVSDQYKWHSQMVLRPKNATELTRHDADYQKLGSGWIAVPVQPPNIPN